MGNHSSMINKNTAEVEENLEEEDHTINKEVVAEEEVLTRNTKRDLRQLPLLKKSSLTGMQEISLKKEKLRWNSSRLGKLAK